MKIDTTARIKVSLRDARDFDTQLAEAKASGLPFATAVLPGDRRAVYFHTPEELAHFATLNDATTVDPTTPNDVRIRRIEAALIANGMLTGTELDDTTPRVRPGPP